MPQRMARAKIVDNLLDVIDQYFEGKEGHRFDDEFIKLCERINGCVIDLVFIGEDAFEAIDNNYWIPECCYKLID